MGSVAFIPAGTYPASVAAPSCLTLMVRRIDTLERRPDAGKPSRKWWRGKYGEFRYPECHRLTVDTYAVQYPGTPSRQSIQSVGGHLVGLHLVLERGLDSKKTTRALGRAVDRSERFVWLEPPASPTWLTVLDVRGAGDLPDHEQRVRLWAESVWKAWALHHDTVRRWATLP